MTKSIVLFGYRCTGKTEKGKMIAAEMGWNFIDADDITKTRLSIDGYSSIDEVVKKLGWPTFRSYEHAGLQQITMENSEDPVVLALGGGAFANTHHEEYRLANIALMKKFGVSFYLLPFEDLEKTAGILARRQLGDKKSGADRPDLSANASAVTDYETLVKKNIAELTIRDPMYRAAADYVVLTQDKPQEQVAKEIVELYLAHR